MKKIFSNGVTVFIVIGAIAVIAFDGFSSSLLPDGTVAPELTFEKLGGGTLDTKELAGQVVLLDFWATWCPPCREEMPWLVSLEKEFEAKGVRFVAASEDDERPLVGIYAKDKVLGLEPYAVFSNAAGDSEVPGGGVADAVRDRPRWEDRGVDARLDERVAGAAMAECGARSEVAGVDTGTPQHRQAGLGAAL